MQELKFIIAKNIQRLRQERGMTQLELAEKLNYSDKTISGNNGANYGATHGIRSFGRKRPRQTKSN